MGSMAIVADASPKNYIHIIYNNGAHDSVGGQPTVGLKIDICSVAKALGYKHVYATNNKVELENILEEIKKKDGPILLEVKVRKGNRKDLGRPTTTPIQNKESLMSFLKD
jgi:phosphonopyruvate decarboxylase